MKEILKNKTVIILILFIFSITFISGQQARLEDSENNSEYLVYNVQ